MFGAAAVDVQWRRLAGDDYDAARVFLRPAQEPAAYYPCMRSYNCGCDHRVITHSEDDIVAVCTCEMQGCDTFHLNRSDIIVYELDRTELYKAIAQALPIEIKEAQLQYSHRTAQIGFYIPSAGIRFPVFLAIHSDSIAFQHTVYGLLTNERGPFILLSPTSDLCKADCVGLLRDRGAIFLTLEEMLKVDESGKFVFDRSCLDLFAGFQIGTPGSRVTVSEPNAVSIIPYNVFRHKDGYRIVWLHEKQLEPLTKTQAQVVQVLHCAYEQGRPEMSFAAISLKLDNPPVKMSHIFRNDDSRKVIIKRVNKDIYRLNI